jgi:biopolymer transport protein ExbB/TolQ
MNYVNQFLNFISDGLLLPAVTIEIILLFWALWAVGAFAAEYWQRARISRAVRVALEALTPDAPEHWRDTIQGLPAGRFRDALTDLAGTRDRRRAARRIAAFESACHRDLDRARLLARLGPIVGLMGTLIPKGHALGQLALGDISAMTQNLQVAFANTVVGLFIGALGFIVQQGRQRWYTQEIDALDYVHDLLFEPVER